MRGFHFEDSHSRLHVGRLDVHGKSPGKAGAQPLFQRGKILRSAIRGDDDLLVRLIKVVENVEERFLRGVPAADELDVIDHKDVASAVFLPETVALLIALAVHHFHKLVDDGLGVGVHHLGLRGVFEEIVADGVQKVGFPKPHSTVNEEGIVFSRRVLRHRLCGCESILVGFPLHKGVEGVFFQERILFLFLFFGVFLVNDQPAVGQRNTLFFEIFPLLLLDYDLDIGDKRIKG